MSANYKLKYITCHFLEAMIGLQIKSWYLKGYYCIKCETSKKTEPLLTKLALSLILILSFTNCLRINDKKTFSKYHRMVKLKVIMIFGWHFNSKLA